MYMRDLRDKYRIGIDAVIEHRYHNFVGWDPEALRHFRDVIEDSIKEAHAREHQIFNRAGALLSLCGVVLALIASFGIGMGFPDDVGIFLSIGTVMILISCFVIGWSIVPNYRVTISMSSGENGYDLHLKDPDRGCSH